MEYGNNYNVIMRPHFAFSYNSVILVLFCEIVWRSCLMDTEKFQVCAVQKANVVAIAVQ